MTDDAVRPASERASRIRIGMRLSRAAIGVESIGHFALFHNRFETSLWPTTLGWPHTSQLAATTPGVIVSRHNTRD